MGGAVVARLHCAYGMRCACRAMPMACQRPFDPQSRFKYNLWHDHVHVLCCINIDEARDTRTYGQAENSALWYKVTLFCEPNLTL